MAREKISSLDTFLSRMDVEINNKERFCKRKSTSNPVVHIDYSAFLDDEHKIKENLFSLAEKTIRDLDLRVYFVMLSWWGRGDQAEWTGSNLFENLMEFQKRGMCRLFLSYQAGEAPPSSLYRWCRKKKIPVLDVDNSRLLSREGKVVVPEKAPGKAENMVKALKMIQQIENKEKNPPEKVLVLFLDDDYTQFHWMNYFMMFAPWVFSFLKKTGDEQVDAVLNKVKKIGFIKSGSPRIILPYEIQDRIVRGSWKPLDYLGISLALVELALSHQRFSSEEEKEGIEELISLLNKIRKSNQIFSPKNRLDFLGRSHNQRLERIWREYIYRGGRVTQRLEAIFRYLSGRRHCRWLREFTFLLHGDQGAPLNTWLEFSPFSGYALEIGLLMQTVCDKAFEEYQILNILGLPHSHQRSKELDIWNMLDTILFALDLSRVLYKDLSVKSLINVYGYQQYYPMLDRFGNVTIHTPHPQRLKIYPPLKLLDLA
ncbi:MAG: hypothetical protein ACOC57_00695 [Acidobacteriota bacterium]